METPKIQIVETSMLAPGDFAIFHKYDTPRGLPCMAARVEGTDDLRLVPFRYPPDPQREFAPMYESAFAGVAVRPVDVRLEVDFGSVVNGNAARRVNPEGTIIGVGERLVLPIRFGPHQVGYMDVETGLITRGHLQAPWVAFDRWRVVDGGEPPVQLFASAAWGKHEDE